MTILKQSNLEHLQSRRHKKRKDNLRKKEHRLVDEMLKKRREDEDYSQTDNLKIENKN
jgi:hypothetical protein